jgi:hypothetical protein
VYSYETAGYEQIDNPNSRHDYPEETAITLRHTQCGFLAHWQPLENRWDEMEVCSHPDGGLLERMASHREFYGKKQHSDLDCRDGDFAWQRDPGSTWSTTCSDDKTKIEMRARTVGHEPMEVGGETVRAVHIQIEGRISGDAEGSWSVHRWLHPDTGLLLRLDGRTQATSDGPMGPVQYTEEIDLRLQSLQPER